MPATVQPVLAVHAHFYQPPRENPWTEEVGREASAAPFHDWNERIAAECYAPNAAARVVDDAGRVVGIVNNYEYLSFDAGPTLASWLERHDAASYAAMLAADAARGGAIAQAHGHLILPLASPRDVRTQVRWGLADFAHRFGRPAEGMWLPEAAVDEEVLAVLAEEGVAFTILAPHQAAPEHQPLDTSRPYRWVHPDGSGRSVALVFYDGGLSHSVAFELGSLSSSVFLDLVTSGRHGLVAVAADGETFGHHHRWGERLVAHALAHEAPARGVAVTNLARYLAVHPPETEVRVHTSSWSCAHGVGRWSADCGCTTGGQPGWNQRWRAPLREALDLLRDRAAEVFERRGRDVLVEPWTARDEYLAVVLGAVSHDEFAAAHVTGDPVVAFSLLEAQRHAMAMYTSCGWFFSDVAGLEAAQVLRYAARLVDLLVELGEDPGQEAFLECLAKAESNVAEEGNGADIWRRRVLASRVEPWRAVAHLALLDVVEDRPPGPAVGAWDVTVSDHVRSARGALAVSAGSAVLRHRRTLRRSTHVWAALHLGGLEVVGSIRSDDDAGEGARRVAELRAAFDGGSPVTTLLRLVSALGEREFDASSALPGAADEIVERAARDLRERFAVAYDHLVDDHWDTLRALTAAGYPLPPEVKAPAEVVLARRLEAEVLAQGGSLDVADYAGALRVAREARAGGFSLDTPGAREAVERVLVAAVERAVDGHGTGAGLAVLRLAGDLGVSVSLDRAQELVVAAAGEHPGRAAGLRELAEALNVVVA